MTTQWPGSGMLARRRTGLIVVGSCLAMLFSGVSGARADDLDATPSTFKSVFASADGGDTIHLASGDYGSFGGGSKSSMVTITPKSGATASMSATFNPSDHIRLDGLTIRDLTFLGNTHDITVSNSKFTGQAVLRAEQMVNAGIVFDHDTFANINVCDNCYEGRLQVAGQGPGPVGVTVQNSVFGPGGDADGIQTGAYGLKIFNNEFTGIRQVDAVHTDALQLYGQRATAIVGNYFHDDDVDIMAPDGGDHEQITDNVFVGNGDYRPAIQLGSQDTTTFAHNTVLHIDVHMDRKSESPDSSRNGVLGDNVFDDSTIYAPSNMCASCNISYNLFSSAADADGLHVQIGAPRFLGGSDPDSYAGYALAAGSPGKGDASDGSDLGVRMDAPSPTPTPTPSPTPSPTPTPTDVPAKASWTAPSNVRTGTPVTLDGTRSQGNPPLACTWSFENEDGSILWETEHGCKISKTFLIADTKYVTLSVRDADGDRSSSRQSFPVSSP